MRSYFDNPRAFAPMFTDPVSVRTSSGDFEVRVVGNLVSCGFDDPLLDGSAATVRRKAVLMIPVLAWAGERKPSVGMIVETAEFRRFAVTDVDPFHGDCYTLQLRECPC